MKAALYLMVIVFATLCTPKQEETIITVTGDIGPDQMGVTLSHEHVLVDFTGAELEYLPDYNREEAFNIILPHIIDLKKHGVKTFVDCTPKYLGRDPLLLKRLSEETGIQFITNTGFYGALENKYIPREVLSMPAEAISAFWIAEYRQGIDGTGVRPGFIKIGVESGELSPFHRTLVKAAAQAHKATGMIIKSHTGKAIAAFQQLEILKEEGVKPDAFIWTHAQNEKDLSRHVEAARMGAWISIDGFWGGTEKADELVEMVINLKRHNCLHRILLSQDAGWYDPEKPGGENYQPHTLIFTELIPVLNEKGITDADINKILTGNAAKAFTIKKRLIDPEL
jgi:predicted metal-dependent phosphotriesterase family hydrolase